MTNKRIGRNPYFPYSLPFLLWQALVFVIPLFIFIFRAKNSIPWMVTAAILINIGMWMERFVVIVPTETRPRLLYELVQGSYRPTWTEWLITAALFSGMALLYAIFTRLFPIIPLWETAESLEHEPEPKRPGLRRFGEPRAQA